VAPAEGKFKQVRQRRVSVWELYQRLLEDRKNFMNPFRGSRIWRNCDSSA